MRNRTGELAIWTVVHMYQLNKCFMKKKRKSIFLFCTILPVYVWKRKGIILNFQAFVDFGGYLQIILCALKNRMQFSYTQKIINNFHVSNYFPQKSIILNLAIFFKVICCIPALEFKQEYLCIFFILLLCFVKFIFLFSFLDSESIHE